jgi:hypothetical protein
VERIAAVFNIASGQFKFLRELVQKVVVLPSSDGKTAELTVHGRLAAILASIKAVDEHTAQKRGAFHAEYTRRVKARDFRATEEKLDFVARSMLPWRKRKPNGAG